MSPGAARVAAGMPLDYVDSDRSLITASRRLAHEPRLALDTEFVSERTYLPQLEVIQIAVPTHAVLIDCQKVRDLRPFFDLMGNPAIEKVFHAAQQDLELFQRLGGAMPTPVFDTQLAAAMAGYGTQPGYAHLVERLLGVALEKSETLTDWSRRPLSDAQIAYAVDDVRYLLPLYDLLRKRLVELGRWEWLQEEIRAAQELVREEVSDPTAAFLRVRGRGKLRAKGLVVLRELAAWREEVARERNKPRSTIARDEALVEIARKAPTTAEALRGMRAVRSRELDRHAEQIVARIAAALRLPREEWPQPEAFAVGDAPAGVIELLQAVLRARAEEAHIAPSLIATSADLQWLVQHHRAGHPRSSRLLHGWRRQIVGDVLLSILKGQATVLVNPLSGHLEVRSP